MDCIFCKIAKGEIPSAKVFEDENTFAFLDINPIAKGHCLIIPKKHSDNVFDIEGSILKDIIVAVKKISEVMKEALGATSVNLVNSSGKHAEQGVPHFHFHIIPRYENDGLDMTGWWQSKVKEIDLDGLKELAEKIKQNLD